MEPTTRPARSRGLSFRSDKSGGSKTKVDLTESPAEKARRDSIWKNTSKANPNAALNEVQPGVANQTEAQTLQSLRGAQHKDANGNPIVDPDLSNPTRPRLERPLDTIRSFEKAIDQGYKRRSSHNNGQNNQYESRRNSYYGGNDGRHPSMGGGNNGGGYYGNQRSGNYTDQNGRVRYGNRMQSEGAIGGYGRLYNTQHGYYQSQDTMNTAVTNGSDSTGPWANSTDPSSENSSIDQSGNNKQPAYGQNGYGQSGYGQSGHGANGYGGTGFGSPPIMEEQAQNGYGYGGPVQVPQQQHQPRRPIPLGNSGDAPPPPPSKLPSNARAEPEKKKGWLKRRFSKND